MTGDLEDKYLQLRDENTALKKKKNEQEATIKRMYTKLAIIEEALKKKRNADENDNQDDPETGGRLTGAVVLKRDLETEKFIHALKAEITILKKKNQSLAEKNRILEEKLRHRQFKHTFQRTSTGAGAEKLQSNRSDGSRSIHKDGGIQGSTLEKQVESARKLHRDTLSGDLEVALKNRLVVAEKQLIKLQRENEELRTQSKRTQTKIEKDNNDDGHSDEDENDTMSKNSKTEIEHLKRELRDRQAQLAILNARYENLESNALAEREIQEKTLEQMEHMNRQVHKLRTQLQDTTLEKDDLEVKMAKYNELEKEIVIVRDQNRRLEERMTTLCESPFINDAFQRKERIDKLFDLEKLTEQQKTTIVHMTEENHKLQVIVKELQSNIKLIKQAKDLVEQEMEKVKQRLVEERNARSLTITKEITQLSSNTVPEVTRRLPITIQTTSPTQPEKRDASSSPLRADHSRVFDPTQQLNTAKTVVTRRYGDVSDYSNLTSVSTSESDNSVKHLRNRVHVLQIAHLKAMQELERCEKMLHAQTNINRELALEIEELTERKVISSNALEKKMKEVELLAGERQQRIHQMEAEIRQLKYAREKLLQKMRDQDDDATMSSSSDEENSDTASLSESLIFAASDLSPGEQLMELWIISGNFDRNVVSGNSSTFVVCDFYDFESQSTPLLLGNRPEYNFSSTFKITVDGFFLRYLASEMLVLEVHQAVRGDFKRIGSASIRLSGLLLSKAVIKEKTLPVKLFDSEKMDDNETMGTLNVIIRLSTPISEIWRLHLRSYPQDAQLLSKHRKQPTLDADAFVSDDVFEEQHNRQVNELQITVFACRNLRSYGKKKGSTISRIPSSYVHYQLLGFPDIFTNIVPETSNPQFDLECCKQAFTLEVDGYLLRFFSKFRLWFTVFDDLVEVDDNGQNDGMVGRCGLALSELVHGECIRGWFPLLDRNDQQAGEISVLIEWKDPFQVLQISSSQRARSSSGRLADTHTLDFEQQHAVLSMFSQDMDGRVNYRQFMHYVLPSEDLELLTSKIKERFEYAIDSQQIQTVHEVFEREEGSRQRGSDITPAELVKVMETYGIFLSESELQLLSSVFMSGTRSIHKDKPMSGSDYQTNEKVVRHYLLLYINPRVSCAQRLLCHKLRRTLRSYIHSNNQEAPYRIFEKFDPNGCGRVTRAEFKRCLRVFGFDLLDIEKEYKELIQTQSTARDSGKQELSKVSREQVSEVDLDEEELTTVRGEETGIPMKSSKPSVGDTKGQAHATSSSQPITSRTAAATEFHRRKQAFMDRMKAIAASSAKSVVYEQLEKKNEQQRLEAEAMQSHNLPPVEQLQQKIEKLHVPQLVHHNAARTLQKKYRYHRTQQQISRQQQYGTTTILDADIRLQQLFKRWTSNELETLEKEILYRIENDIPEAKKTRLVSKKQFGFVLGQIPRVAFDPSLLSTLMEYFSVSTRGTQSQVSYRALAHFICSVSTEETDIEKHQQHGVLKCLKSLCFDDSNALDTFTSVGDMKHDGTISFRRFRDSLQRLDIHLTMKDLRMLIALIDYNGVELLYHAFLQAVRQMPLSVQLRDAIERCQRFGLAGLREKILIHVNSEDGFLSKQDLHNVLMQISNEFVRFDPKDAHVLFTMVKPKSDTNEKISMDELYIRLEKAMKSRDAVRMEEFSTYNMYKLQRLAWNCRKLICGCNYSVLVAQFGRFDWKERGIVSLQDFIAIMKRIGFMVFSTLQMKQIARCFSAKVDGSFGINYRQFLDWTTPSAAFEMDDIEAKLRNFAQTQAEQLPSKQVTHVLEHWRQSFSETDKTSTGYLNRSTFAKACREQLRLPLNEEELRVVLYTYDHALEDHVDYNAFLQLNWREAKKSASQKVVQFEKPAMNVDTIVAEIKQQLLARKTTYHDIIDSFKKFCGSEFPKTGESAFLLALKHQSVVLLADKVHAIFDAYGETLDKRKLNAAQFVHKILCIQPREDSKTAAFPLQAIGEEGERRLDEALKSTVRYSATSFQHSFSQFQEFCVVHRFGDIEPTKLWKHMESNGFVDLISPKCMGLLVQKFLSASNSENDVDDRAPPQKRVSLREIHAHLARFNQGNHVPSSPPKVMPVRHATDISEAVPNAMEIVRQLVDSCDEQGINLRGAFEQYDQQYTRCITALEFKQVLLRLRIDKLASPSPAEFVIGQLIRQFRDLKRKDAINYTTMLYEALNADDAHNPKLTWYHGMSEHLRTRIRLKAGFSGTINLGDSSIYMRLDAAFAHFDQRKRGFLSIESLQAGLSALKYELTSVQLEQIMTRMSIFKNKGGGLSRMEFDSFVLDPYASRWIQKLAMRVYAHSQDQNQQQPSLVARLSRSFMENDHPDHRGVLPKQQFWSCLEETMGQRMTTMQKLSLQHLFDVNRDGMVAYKLFLKVVSQWWKSLSARPQSPSTRAIPTHPHSRHEVNIGPEIPYLKQDLLRSLYHQLSSIDFNSQVDIAEEYLQRKDVEHTGIIKLKHLLRIFDQLGLSLSKDAVASLLALYETTPHSSVVCYQRLLDGLRVLHEEKEEGGGSDKRQRRK